MKSESYMLPRWAFATIVMFLMILGFAIATYTSTRTIQSIDVYHKVDRVEGILLEKVIPKLDEHTETGGHPEMMNRMDAVEKKLDAGGT